MNLARHYRTLGLRRGASTPDVKAAYRKLVRRYHPDINPDEAAIEQFIKINDAYTALSQAIDRNGRRGTAAPTPKSTTASDINPISTGQTKLDSRLVSLMQTLERMGLGDFSGLDSSASEPATSVSREATSVGHSKPTYVVEQPETSSAPTQTMEPAYPGVESDGDRPARSLSAQEAALKQDAYEQLKELLKQQKFPRAIALVEGLAHRMPEDSEVIQWQAIVYQRWGRKLIDSGQPKKARIYLKKALRTDPNNPSLWREINQDFWQLANL